MEEHLGMARESEARTFERPWEQPAAPGFLGRSGQASLAAIVRCHMVLADVLDIPAVLVDPAGALIAASVEAQAMIEGGDLIRAWDGRLQAVSPVGDLAFREALEDIAQAARNGIAQCVRHHVVFDVEGHGRLAKLSRVQGVDPDEDRLPALITLRALRDTACVGAVAAETALARRFNLSRDEFAVGHGLLLGQSVREIAEDRWAPIEAIRREMTSLYCKIGGLDAAPVDQPMRALAG